jgi:hypothetical protein
MCAVGAQRKFRAGGQIQISNRNFFVDSGTDPRKHIRACPSLSLEENIVVPLRDTPIQFRSLLCRICIVT